MVCMIRKPNKKDPSSPRSYRPITLEECLGKLLEKIITTRLQDSALQHNLLPLNQFGGHIKSGVINVCIDLCDEIQTAIAQKLYVSVLCCDVKGFFDNVTLHPLQTSLSNMGLAPHLVRWITSFTSKCKVRIAFDRYTHPSLDKPNRGVPQGSPISPILAELFVASTLQLFPSGHPVRLRAYVNDHTLSTASTLLAENEARLTQAYHTLETHLASLGLALEADKTELMHFYAKLPSQHPANFSPERANNYAFTLPLLDGLSMKVSPVPVLRWLGIFFNPTLSFIPHIK